MVAGVEGIEILTEKRNYIIICDIDDCFLDSRALAPYIPTTKSREDWDNFMQYYSLCKPNKHIIDLVCATTGLLPIFFLTSREDRHGMREVTKKQLYEASNGIIDIDDPNKPDRLYMRHDCDYRHSDIVKQAQLVTVVKEGFIPIVVIDDNEDNCKMFRKYNLPVCQYNINMDRFV